MNNRVVGLSNERSPSGIKQWKKFLNTLNVDYKESCLEIQESVKKADSFFEFSTEHCFFRRSCLGQYLDLIEQGCTALLIPVKYKDEYNNCNATRFMAKELASAFSPEIDIISVEVHTDPFLRKKELLSVARHLCSDRKLISKAIDQWDFSDHLRINVYANYEDSTKVSLMIIGKINKLFDYTYELSPMCNYLSKNLDVNILDPETMPYRDISKLGEARKLVNKYNLSYGSDYTHWPHELIIYSVLSNMKKIDGIVFLRDCFCTSGLEDIKILQRLIRELNIPNIVCSFNLEARSSIETTLDTFVSMLKLRKGKKHVDWN